jgi:hypothetical protein
MEGIDWKMVMNNDQVWTLVMGILFALSEVLGMFKRGPNGLLHGVWKFYNLKVEVEYDADGEVIERENPYRVEQREEIRRVEEIHRVEQTKLPNRETMVLEAEKNEDITDPNVLLIGNKNA